MIMDLNELLHAHQVAVMKASAAGKNAERDGHFEKVALYAEEIRALRDLGRNGNLAAGLPGNQTIIYASYAGDPVPVVESPALSSWEGEGGAIEDPSTPLPDGVTSTLVRRYSVGPYRYDDLDLALAEHARQHPAPPSAEGRAAFEADS